MNDWKITGKTKLGALLGSPVAHSLSPSMYNDSFMMLGIDYVYLCFDVKPEGLEQAVSFLRSQNTFGFNLTMPLKEFVLPCLDELSPAARMIGAVNTVSNKEGVLTGHNTDGVGYMRSLRDAGFSPAGKEMTLLGAGGAAGAIAVQAALDGIKTLHIVNRRGRSYERALRLAEMISTETACRADVTPMEDTDALGSLLLSSDLLTNATSVGMAPDADCSPIPDPAMLTPNLLVSDIIYNPRKTKLMQDAERAGAKTCGGLYMLLYQGEEAFRIYTGQQMPTEEIRRRYFA